jgi:hypothetical protein
MSFTFKYWTNRWKGTTIVRLTHTPTGWHLSASAHSGDCNKSGVPLFYSNFAQDYVAYPHKIGMTLEHAWEQIASGAWTNAGAQERLQELADWVTATETAEPKWPGWN